MLRYLMLFLSGLTLAATLRAAGTISGLTRDQASGRPLEYVAVTLKKPDGTVVQSTVTDARGRFTLEDVPPGEYDVVYAPVGAESPGTRHISVDAQKKALDLGALELATNVVKLEQVEVKGSPSTFLNSIDRKVYNVGKEIQSATGSAGDLLQNIPSVQVDIDGNVSLRGSSNVMILVNGRSSVLMGRSRAEVLQQLPADAIERIEVITNPSAKYKPDGTAGIINLALKKKSRPGFSGVANAAVGTEDRYNAGFSANYHPGKYNLFGSVSVRQDDRERRASDVRSSVDPLTGATTRVEKKTVEHSRPFFRLLRGGADYDASEDDKVGLSFNYEKRSFDRRATDFNVVRNGSGALTSEYDRTRFDPEWERSREGAATWDHTFAEDHELKLEVKCSQSDEVEDNHYANLYRTPAIATTFDNTLIQTLERVNEAIVEYTRALPHDAKFEAGYTLTENRLNTDFGVANFDPVTARFVSDATKSNRFAYRDRIHAFYATYGQTFGKFGFLAGLRPEFTTVTSRLVNTGVTIPNDYARVYPSLHLAYKLTGKHEVQWNYSHRIHRPESDELNPFPEYADPFNLRAGNPRLLPEDVHSIEAGYGYTDGDTSFTATVYHRYLYHGFTTITRDIGGGVLLTTRDNLAENRSSGLELTANTEVGKLASLNFSANGFYNTIDVSNLGLGANKSDVSWIAKLGTTLHLPRSTTLQFNANYSSARLTAQGERRPSFVANLGARHDFHDKKAAVVLTISDLFNSLKEASRIDTPLLRQDVERRRSARIVYLGLIYNFGKPTKKSKDDAMKFDNAL